MYLGLIREEEINTGNIDVEWFNGLDNVNGVIGAFENVPGECSWV